jgi:hypothetical protein
LDIEINFKAYELNKPIVQLDNSKLMEKYHKLSNEAEPLPCSVTKDLLTHSPQEVYDEGMRNFNEFISGDEKVFSQKDTDDPGVIFRNKAWMPKILRELNKGDAFIAVGADHLFGTAGIIALLTNHGYVVTRVPK